MAFRRYGSAASVEHSSLRRDDWLDYLSDQRRRSKVASSATGTAHSLTDQVAEILGRPFDPGEWVLSHATLVASVDTYVPKVAKVGRHDVGGFRVNCRFPDYRVTAATQKYANNNHDGFSRGVLLKSYRTLIGGQVFVEHVQLEELSKGRIFDAVARDIGESIYVDILAGTHRSHADLCAGIESGAVSKMSMGTDIVGSSCAKCGNWAADDTEMCPCMQHFKGDIFTDEDGNPHRIIDLCGHADLPGGGNTFKEGSWVELPAFTGAVNRNLIQVPGARRKNSPPVTMDLRKTMAGMWYPAEGRTASVEAQDPVEFEEDQEFSGGAEQKPPQEASPLDESVAEVEQYLLDKAMSRVRDRLREKKVDQGLPLSTKPNDSILHQAGQSAYRMALSEVAATTKSPVRRLLALHHLNKAFSVEVPQNVYRLAAQAVRRGRTASVSEFISSCKSGAGSAPTPSEARSLVRVARFLLRGDT